MNDRGWLRTPTLAHTAIRPSPRGAPRPCYAETGRRYRGGLAGVVTPTVFTVGLMQGSTPHARGAGAVKLFGLYLYCVSGFFNELGELLLGRHAFMVFALVDDVFGHPLVPGRAYREISVSSLP